ncbi:MAG TPA: hypothetical protein ENI79_01515 [Rhodospirillales bacterium]|nr:hypothetical protein [Rhodospirillales bacterium]
MKQAARDDAILPTIAVFYAVLWAAKFLIAGNLDLFYDEATYWQASLRPAFGYIQSPPMTPLLIRAGTIVFGDALFGVRIVHLLIAAALPFAIYLLAQPLVGRRDAILAAGVSLVMPLTGVMGEAYMDPPMILFTVLALAAFERARRTDSLAMWLMVGLFCALGLATHYRFAPFGLGLLAYLLITRKGRSLWSAKGLWIAAGIAALGAAPLIIFNAGAEMASFQFQVMDRNPWTFQAKGVRFPLEQILVVTPFLFVALMGVMVHGVRRARAGDDGAALLVIVSIVYIGFYAVLAPFSDLRRMHVHWPAAGYIPLFVLLPGVLRRFAVTRVRRVLRWLVPASGALVVFGGVYYLAAAAWPTALFPDFLYRYVRHDLVKWSRLEAPLKRYLEESFDGRKENVILAASNYQVGSELDFILKPPGGVYMLNHPKNRKEGIDKQYVIWGLDEDSMRTKRAGAGALIVVEDKNFWFESAAEVAWRGGLCGVFDNLRQLGALELPGGQKNFLIYAGRVRGGGELDERPRGPGNCPTLPSAYLTRPKRGGALKGVVDINGWALDDAVGVSKVEAVGDGKAIATAFYGNKDPRVLRLMPGSTDPNHPWVNFIYEWDTATVAEGKHKVEIRVHSADGEIRDFGRRTVFIVHP